jgi:ribulose-5-phosphate 4-epimerase/fuculose-1-phosphate aldolase
MHDFPRKADCPDAPPGLSCLAAAQEIMMSNLATLKTARSLESSEWQLRVDLAAAFRLAAINDWHEAVANHFSLAVSGDGKRFLINPNQRHFARIKASDLLLLDADDPDVLTRPDAPDPTAWGLHGSVHRLVPHARCVMHVHSIFATVLASLEDSALPPIDQNTAMFFGRTVIDENYGGLAFEEEGMRCAGMLGDPKVQVMIMGNHGVLVIGATVAEGQTVLIIEAMKTMNHIPAPKAGTVKRILVDDGSPVEYGAPLLIIE